MQYTYKCTFIQVVTNYCRAHLKDETETVSGGREFHAVIDEFVSLIINTYCTVLCVQVHD